MSDSQHRKGIFSSHIETWNRFDMLFNNVNLLTVYNFFLSWCLCCAEWTTCAMKLIRILLIAFGFLIVRIRSLEHKICDDLCRSRNYTSICEINTKSHISCDKLPLEESKFKCPKNTSFEIDIEKKFVAVTSNSKFRVEFWT